MKLFHTPTSPFVRKVMVSAHELGVPIETTYLRPSPMAPDPILSRDNPLSKIPALVLDDGSVLFDSPVICEYLDSTFGPKLVPRAGPERWRVLRLQALADGALEAGVLVFYERSQRPKESQYEPWLASQSAKVTQALDALEREVPSWPGGSGEPDLGQIAVACMLGWLDFRKPIGDWRPGRPALTSWYERFIQRPSMQATMPA